MDNFVFYCKGHPNIRATHKSTLEFTKDEDLSLSGNCILGVSSTNNLADIPIELKGKIRSTSRILVEIHVNNYIDIIKGYGNSKLELSDKYAMIIRKSDFICSRTLMIKADKAAHDIDGRIIESMKNPNNKMKVSIQLME